MQEGFDLAIRIGHLADSSLIARRLATIQGLMCASPDYLKHMGTPKTPEDLSKHQCLVYNLLRDYEYWHLLDKDGQSVKVKINAHLKASNGEFLCDAAVKGMGIVFMPTFITYKEIESGELVHILPNYRNPPAAVHAIYPKTRHLSHRVRAFVDFLVERFKGTPYWDCNT